MKPQEIRDLTTDEMAAKVDKLKKELFDLRVQAKTGKLEKQARIQAVKRDIARLLTIKNELSSKTQK
ncbi:MAG: 50S ribosomal protein L29 [Candidatus Omnitrophica bacterium]|nr:50S ribosomal protein L29 [Candidatus Omnitrophota bacterium]